jgi:hypothetical protein
MLFASVCNIALVLERTDSKKTIANRGTELETKKKDKSLDNALSTQCGTFNDEFTPYRLVLWGGV